MRRIGARVLLPVAAALVLIAPAGRAAGVSSGPVWGVELFGGWSTYAMSDINDQLALTNQQLGTSFDDITSGTAGGLGLRMWPSENVLLRLDLEAMLAESENSGVTFDIGPGAAVVSATYYFPSTSPMRFGLGAGVGEYSIIGEIKGPGGKLDTSGDGFGAMAMGEALWPMSGRWSMTGTAGYRFAKVNDVKFEDQSSHTEADFSGVMLRVGLAYDWSPRAR